MSRRQKPFFLLVVVSTLAAGVIFSHSTAAQEPTLEWRVKQLEQQVEKLEAQVQKMQVQIRTMGTQAAIPADRLRSVPPGAKTHEFNGIRYYLVPIQP